jgi:hypothetical protein
MAAINRLPERLQPEAPRPAMTASFDMTKHDKKGLARRVTAEAVQPASEYKKILSRRTF